MSKAFVQRLGALLCVLALLVCALPPQTVMAETLKEKIERLKGELDNIEGTIEGLENSKASYEQLKREYEAQYALLEEYLEANLQSMQETQGAIDAKQVEISDKRQVIYENEQLFQDRLVAIYKMNTASPVSTLLSANSFSEFLTVANNLQALTKHDTELLQLLATQREELEGQLAELDELLAELNQKNDEFNQNMDLMTQNIMAQQANISWAEAEIQTQETLLDDTYEELEAAQAEQKRILAALSSQGSTSRDGSQFTGGTLTWPVPGFYNVSCEYGSADPNGAAHRGMDIAGGGIAGANVVAGDTGVVLVAAFAHYSYGNYVVVDHGGGIKSLYAHCSSLAVSVGDTVERGQTIAYVGSTGFSTGYHLHFEVHLDGALQNPRAYLSA